MSEGVGMTMMGVKLRDTTRGAGEGISTDQLKAIMALLEHTTVEKAARACGTHKNTIYKWLREDVQFQDAWREARQKAFSATVARLQTASSGAVDTLVDIAEDPTQPGAARVFCIPHHSGLRGEGNRGRGFLRKAGCIGAWGGEVVNRRDLEARIARLEREAKKANVPTPQEYAEAHRRHMARLHEKWAADLGDPGGSLISEGDRAILADDTPEQHRKDEEVIEAWSRGVDLKAEADEARARLLAVR